MGTRRKVESNRQARVVGGRHRQAPPLELLEPRVLLATFTVDTTADAGPGSLREAIDSANALTGSDEIRFDIPGAGPHLIDITGANGPLPTITDPVFINGYSEPGARRNTLPVGSDAVILIEVLGTSGLADGLRIEAAGSTVSGLSIYDFDHGIRVIGPSASANVITGNLIGPTTSVGFAPGNSISGITIDSAPGNTVGGTSPGDRNVISANLMNGVSITRPTASGNVVLGNFIGTDAAGTAALGNASGGIVLASGATENRIGGTTPGERNILSGNRSHGVELSGSATTGNLVVGNYIGTDASGTLALGNGDRGVALNQGATSNTVGGAGGAGNLISGNDFDGILLFDPGTSANLVVGNRLGTDASGLLAIPNTLSGVAIGNGASGNTVGGRDQGARNLLSGNGTFGVFIGPFAGGDSPTRNVVAGNAIGLNAMGVALGNGSSGVGLLDAVDNTIGGDASGAGNVISGNREDGVLLLGSGSPSTGNLVAGNLIGLGADGEAAIGNGGAGVRLLGTFGNTIGGPMAQHVNVISANGGAGVVVPGGSSGVLIQGNRVGTDASGTRTVNGNSDPLGNLGPGILLSGNSDGNTIDANVVSGNLQHGLFLDGDVLGTIAFTAEDNLIRANRVGTDITGLVALPNQLDGILIDVGNDNTIGGPSPSDRNIISGNLRHGVQILDGAGGGSGTGNLLQGNLIGPGLGGAPLLGNGAGGVSLDGAAFNTIGGVLGDDGNTISGNVGAGVGMDGVSAFGNQVLGNRIALNSGLGIELLGGANNGQTAPSLLGAAIAPGATSVTLFGTAPAGDGPFRIELFADVQSDPEGLVFLGASAMDVAQGSPFSENLQLAPSQFPDGTIPNDLVFTATATDVSTGSTSEFSLALDPFVVTSTDDAGAGSLRQVILNANFVPGMQTITFDIPGTGVRTIAVTSGLPAIDDPVFIDAYTQTDASPNSLAVGNDAQIQVELIPNIPGADFHGLSLAAGSDGSSVAGLAIGGFGRQGILVENASGVTIAGNFVGTDASGGVARPNLTGVAFAGTATGNLVGGAAPSARNVISGNDGGLGFSGAASGNRLLGSYIGTDPSGSIAIPNLDDGISLTTANNTIGGTGPGEGNLLSGNRSSGIAVFALGATGNLVVGNLIGTDAAGTVALPNGNGGMEIARGASSNTVGGKGPGTRNIFAGNAGPGLFISRLGATEDTRSNTVLGNSFGLNIDGQPLPNTGNGLQIEGARNNTIGGRSPEARNVFASNFGDGILITGPTASGNLVSGNYIGTDGSGLAPVPNLGGGVAVTGGASANTIGGEAGAGGNVISANGSLFGMPQVLQGPTPGMDDLADLVAVDLIGSFEPDLVVSDRNGFVHLYEGDGDGNFTASQSIELFGQAGSILTNTSSTVYVATGSPPDSLISITRGGGGPPVTGSLDIGFDRIDDLAIGNLDGDSMPDLIVAGDPVGPGGDGLYVLFADDPTSFGPPVPLATGFIPRAVSYASLGFSFDPFEELIAVAAVREETDELLLFRSNLDGTFDPVETFAAGDAPVALAVGDLTGDSRSEIAVASAGDDRVTTLIQSGTGSFSAGPSRDVGLNPEAIAIGDFDGDGQRDIATANQSAGTVSLLRRLPNGQLRQAEAVPVGLGPSALATVETFGSSFRTTLAVLNGSGETISILDARRPSSPGVLIEEAPGNLAAGNTIGLGADGQASLGNFGSGVRIDNASGTTIGGLAPNQANVISANEGSGIEVNGPSSTGLMILGNRVGTDASGSSARGNFRSGVRLIGEVPGAVIRGNLLSGNFGHGLFLDGEFDDQFTAVLAAEGTIIQGNRVGTDASGTSRVANTVDGIHLDLARDTTVGGTAAAQGNLISGNVDHGLSLIGNASFGGNASGTLIQGNFVGTDVTGSLVLGNGEEGLYLINTPGNTIGGLASGAANVIAGNGDDGIAIRGPEPDPDFPPNQLSSGNLIQGNLIGTNAALDPGLGNGQDDNVLAAGIFLAHSPDNTVSGNAINHNIGRGMLISRSGTTGNVVIGNEISSNTLAGIRVQNNASRNTIGGLGDPGTLLVPGLGNVIRSNGGNGIELAVGDSEGNPNLPPPFGIAILGNSIDRNDGLGIDLGADGSTPNDPGDLDVGPNNGQNAPVISSAGSAPKAGQVLIEGSLESTPGLTYRIEFFLTPEEPDGFAEGRTFLGSSLASTGASGLAVFAVPLPFPIGDPGTLVTATATDPAGNTSEFSLGFEVPADLEIIKSAPELATQGSELTYTLGVSNIGLVAASGVVITDPLPPGFQFVEVTSNVGTATETDGVVTVAIDSLSPGQSATVTIVGVASTLGTVTNTATVRSETPDEDPGNDTSTATTTVVAQATDLAITKAAPESVAEGGELAYTLAVSNDGPALASGVVVTDALPAGFRFVGVSTTIGTATETDGVVTVAIDSLSPGQSATVTIVGVASKLGVLSNTATVTSETPEKDPDNNSSTATTTVFSELSFVVLNTNDSGFGSLRQVILNANAFPGVDTITFRIPVDMGTTIRPLSPLPTITEPVNIDGNSQPEGRVEVDGSLAGAGADGLVVEAGGTLIAGLTINRFSGSGIVLAGLGGNRVLGNVIGSDPAATLDLGNRDDGVTVLDSPGNQFVGNVFSANWDNGVELNGPGSSGNLIAGNVIGTTGDGQMMRGNSNAGVLAVEGASGNTIGGLEPGAGNLLSANRTAGVVLLGLNPGQIQAAAEGGSAITSGNLILGNSIGTSAGAGGVLANGAAGVIVSESPDNTIGGSSAPEANIIAGGHAPGVYLVGPGAVRNLVIGNAIGLRPSDSSPIGGSGIGVAIEYGAHLNVIGGLEPGLGNSISNNATAGVQVANAAFDNLVQGNTLGSAGQGPGNGFGVLIRSASSRNTIRGNRIGGNAFGVLIDSAASSNLILGNAIGASEQDGTTGNLQVGLTIRDASDNSIGAGPDEGNVISGNGLGVLIEGPLATGNLVLSNAIGLDAAGTVIVPNATNGLSILNAGGNTIGGSNPFDRNLISGNGAVGVQIRGALASGNVVSGNQIGTRLGSELAAPNGLVGIYIDHAPGNTIGGLTPEAGNVASGNGVVDIQVTGPIASGNLVAGNLVGTGPAGGGSLRAADTGIFLEGAPGNTIGGLGPGSSNLVSGHRFAGIHLVGPGASGNRILGNRIGTDLDGVEAVGNEQGITIDGAPSNTIGGTEPGAGNLISGNTLGVVIANPGGTRNVVLGNLVGTDAGGGRPLPNRFGGIFLNAAPGNTIGGPAPEAGNVISGNDGVGIQVFNPGAFGNVIAANLIGVNRDTTRPIPNVDGGIFINDAPGNSVGGQAGGPGNVVSGNLGSGVVLFGENAVKNAVIGNVIGTPRAGDPPAFGNEVGLFVTGVGGPNDLGGTPDQANVIRGNRVTNTLITGSSGPLVIDGDSLRDASGAITSVRITFSEGLDRTRAEQARNYRLNLGLNGDLGPIPIAGASYDDADHTVSLLLRRPIASNASFRLTVISRPPAGLTNRRGLALDGNNDGSPGGNFIGVFQEGGLRRGPGMDSPTGGRPAPVSPVAVDSIFGTGGLRVARRRP